ncbi:MAG TPA: hypothetical protein VK272_04830 [Solirubrobacteraceae bacterium]|nr:hypothetical protein [Solirubrobacteraceae bacterium]
MPTTRQKLRLGDCDEHARLLLGAASSLALNTLSEQAINSVHVFCAAFDQMPELALDLARAHVSREALLSSLSVNQSLPQLSQLIDLAPKKAAHRATVRTVTPRRLLLGLVTTDASLRTALSQCGADIDVLEEVLGREESSSTPPRDESPPQRDNASAGMYVQKDLEALGQTHRGARLARVVRRWRDTS